MSRRSKLVDDAIVKTEQLIGNYIQLDPNFWKKNYKRLHDTAVGYVELHIRFRSGERIWTPPNEKGIRKKSSFEKKYFWFYVMRYVSEDFRNRYFQRMDQIQSNPTRYTLEELAFELRDGDSIMFSFATKLFNMANGKSPIYDSHVTEAMGLGYYDKFRYIDDPFSRYLECYKAICEVYSRLFDLELAEKVIRDFKKYISKEIPNNETLSNERIMDLVLWQIGRLEQDRKKSESEARKLAKACCIE